jgi:ABC-type multidrug transport system fused ATPase/permease subunit
VSRRTDALDPARTGLGALLDGRTTAVVMLSLTSTVGALIEAAFLVGVTRAAFAITEGRDRFGVLAGIEMTVDTMVIVAVVLVAARVALALVANWQASHIMSSVVASIRLRLASAYLGSTWSAQHGGRSGRLQELLTTYAQRGAELIGSATLAVTSASSLAALLLTALLVDVATSAVALVVVVLLAALLRPLRNGVRRQAVEVASSGMEFATSIGEIADLGPEMHVFNVQDATERRVRALIERTERANLKLAFLRGVIPTAYTGLAYLALIGALGVVSIVDAANFTSVGAVMLLMLRALSYGQSLQTSVASINSALPFLTVLDETVRHYADRPLVDHGEPVGVVGVLAVREVSFEYEDGPEVLRDISLTIPAREVVGIVGPSGSGKSTLVQLLLGLRQPTRGLVEADGRDISVLSRSQWARKVTFVPQDAHLVSGTIADNIRFFREDVSDADVERAARLAHLHDDVAGFADGYQRQVGERGTHLSGGQKQRVAIARALVERPDVLILDEPTSSLDVRSESLIRDTLRGLKEQMTVVVVAHRLSTLEICDRIMVIQDGELRAFDTPANLERDNPFYREALELSGLR